MAGNTLEVQKAVRKIIEKIFGPKNLTVKTAGFKQERLAEPLSHSTGFWEEPNKVSSKPPRLIIQFDKKDETVKATFAKKADNAFFPASKTIGYINNREGNCSAMMFRIIASVKIGEEQFEFPDWEWVLLIVFNRPLPAGNSSETITNFAPEEKTIDYQRRSFKYSLLGIVKINVENDSITIEESEETMTYSEATDALKELLDAGTEVISI